MYRLSDNYYHRKCYFKQQQVPTLTVMKKKLGPLAPVYFKSMSPELKVLAGLEPLLQGGGTEWYMPPEEILAGRHVLKPVNISELKYIRYQGIKVLGEQYRLRHYNQMKLMIHNELLKRDKACTNAIIKSNIQHYKTYTESNKEHNSKKMHEALNEFELMYRQSVSKVEEIVLGAATKEVERIRNEIFQHMEKHYAELLDYQARTLYDQYDRMLNEEKEKIKLQFIRDVTKIRTDMGNHIHAAAHDKHLTIEKLRHFLMCKNLACQVYVALKEREACANETETIKKDYQKKIKTLKKDIEAKDFEVRSAIEQRRKRQEFNTFWKKKVCHIVKKFQTFVQYCLVQLPEHAEFFLDMEKLMLLQISKALENPSTPSIIESTEFISPVPRPHPFYLFCDRGYKPEIDPNLCPIHYTSSAPELPDLPVIVINKRCFYTACDRFDKFTDKVATYLSGYKGDDDDVFEDYNYEGDVPVKITSSQQLLQLKLQSSIMQILQQELPNIRELPVECGTCKLPYCFCRSRLNLQKPLFTQHPVSIHLPDTKVKSGNKIETREEELKFMRDPKWESYFKFVEPKACQCAKAKTLKKHLIEHIPPYMLKESPYEPSNLPNYERCNVLTLKRMVNRAKGLVTPPTTPPETLSKTKTVGVQYLDTDFEYLCTCLSDDELVKTFDALSKNYSQLEEEEETKCSVDAPHTDSFLDKTPSSFATDRAYSLRRLIRDKSSIDCIFRASDCEKYDNGDSSLLR